MHRRPWRIAKRRTTVLASDSLCQLWECLMAGFAAQFHEAKRLPSSVLESRRRKMDKRRMIGQNLVQ